MDDENTSIQGRSVRSVCRSTSLSGGTVFITTHRYSDGAVRLTLRFREPMHFWTFSEDDTKDMRDLIALALGDDNG